MLELVRVYLGYCLNCRRPCYVGEFKLHGWNHLFSLCQSCIDGLSSKVGAEVVAQAPPQLTHKAQGS